MSAKNSKKRRMAGNKGGGIGNVVKQTINKSKS